MIILEKGKGESNYNNNAVFNAFIPRASIAWLPNEQNRIWFGVGRGFKPGGFNKEGVDKLALTSYKSEIATEMELGWKWHSVNDNHMAEITLYQIDSKDVQGYVGVIGYQALSNMGDSRSRGIEYLWKSKLTLIIVFHWVACSINQSLPVENIKIKDLLILLVIVH